MKILTSGQVCIDTTKAFAKMLGEEILANMPKDLEEFVEEYARGRGEINNTGLRVVRIRTTHRWSDYPEHTAMVVEGHYNHLVTANDEQILWKIAFSIIIIKDNIWEDRIYVGTQIDK